MSSNEKKEDPLILFLGILGVTLVVGIIIMLICFDVITDWKWVPPVMFVLFLIGRGIQFINDEIQERKKK